MRVPAIAKIQTTIVLSLIALHSMGTTADVFAAPVTFSGTVTYTGAYSGDSLFVAVLDTTGTKDVTLLDIQAYPVGAPPFGQAYSLNFDNAGITAPVLVASFLDVDGGGADEIDGVDVFGWYAGAAPPTGVSAASSAAGLDFALPLAEIHGTVTFDSTQPDARVNVTPDPACVEDGFRPQSTFLGTGPYSIIGLYAGTYCVNATGFNISESMQVCYGDPTCASPTLVPLGATDVVSGIDLDFRLVSPVEPVSWGRMKTLYR